MKAINFLPILLFLMALGGCKQKVKKDHSSILSSRVDFLPYYEEATYQPHWLSSASSKLDTFHKISPFELINQDGETISEKTFEGKIYVTDFFFTTCPGICPKMTNHMSLLQEAFIDDDEILLLSHSVTPEKDSVKVLKAYAEEKGILSKKWHLATGKREEIYRLGRKEYFVEENLGIQKDEHEFLHTENFVLIDKQRHIRGIYNGLNKTSLRQLIADIKTLKKES